MFMASARWCPKTSSGFRLRSIARSAKSSRQSGDEVNPDSVLLVLTNPQMEADANDFEWQTKQAEANYADLKVRLQSQTFDEQSVVATTQGDLKQAQITKESEEKLFESHLDSQLNAKLAIAKWEQAIKPLSDGETEARHYEAIG